MNDIFQNLQASFPMLIEYKYLLIFLAASVEGFSTIMITGFLLSAHSVEFFPAFIVLVCGEITNGFFWYGVGYWGGAKSIDWIVRHSRKQQQVVARMRSYMEQFTAQAILLAKVTFSLTIVTQILVGSVKYPIKRFSFFNIIGSFGWVILVLSIGFFFGKSYMIIFGYLESVSHFILFFAIALVVVVVLQRVFRGTFIGYVSLVEKMQKMSEKIKNGLNRFMSK